MGVSVLNGLVRPEGRCVSFECKNCFKEKHRDQFYLKSTKGEVPERRDKVCIECKKKIATRKKFNARQKNARSKLAPSDSPLEDVISVFLKLQQWRIERGRREVSNQS